MSDEKLVVALGEFPSLLRLGLEAALAHERIDVAGSNLAAQDLTSLVSSRSVHVVILEEDTDLVALGRRIRADRPNLGILVLLRRPNQRTPYRLLAQGATTCLSIDAAPSALAAAIRLAAEGVQLFVPGGSADSATPLSPLTGREREVATLIAAGNTTTEIAGTLEISEHTVYKHVTAIMRKLHASSRRELRQILAVVGEL